MTQVAATIDSTFTSDLQLRYLAGIVTEQNLIETQRDQSMEIVCNIHL